MFFREGASYGLLFHARNNLALSASLIQQRQERIAAGGVTEREGQDRRPDVSYLASPDGTVRSYYVADGDFHFVTTSKKLVGRFLATASGRGSLGASQEFRHARVVDAHQPRRHRLAVCVRRLFPQHHRRRSIASRWRRRLQAAADIDLVQLARLAAAAEGQPGDTIEQLKAAGLLPPEFGPLPDGSRMVLDRRRGLRQPARPARGVSARQRHARRTRSPAPRSPITTEFADFYRDAMGTHGPDHRRRETHTARQ